MTHNGRPVARAALILIVSFLMAPAGLAAVSVHGVSCATGLSPALHFTLLVPTSNPARRAWAAIIQSELQCLGMDVSRVELPFSPNIYDRALTPPASNVGKTFDQGGFDVLFVGYNLGIDPDPYSLYHSSQFAPSGGNYYLWNNAQDDNLTNLVKGALDPAVRANYVQQWQVLANNELPSIPILYDKEIVAFDSNFPNAQSVFSVYHFPAWPPVEHLSTASGVTSLILAETGQAPGQGIVPELSTSYYDLAVSGEIFGALAIRNDTIFQNMVPELAAGTDASPGWSLAADNTTWTVNIRPSVPWQDGVCCVNATDVKFTFDLVQNDTFGSPVESFVKGIVGGMNNVTITNPGTPGVGGGTVVFHLPSPYAYFVQNILTTAILPSHILKAFSADYSQIDKSLFNNPATGSTAVSASLPRGTGPYIYKDYNSATSTNHLMKNANYFDFPDWGTSALAAKGQFGVQDYYVRTIVGGDQAVTALSSGEVDILDSQYHLETQPNFLSTWGSSKLSIYNSYGVQEMGVNMEHPVLGTGTATPYALAHPGNATAAADAARWIRQAISYSTPRENIISQLLNGYGVPSITTPVVGYYNSTSNTCQTLTQGFNCSLRPYAFNLTKAGQLLQEAGYTPVYGGPFSIYAVYAIAGVVVAAVAVGAVYILRVRRKAPAAVSTPRTSPPPTSTNPP